MGAKTLALRKTAVYLEVGTTRVFACAVDWPGWCRSGKTEEAALANLAEYSSRFAPVAKKARISFPAGIARQLKIVARIPGSATTDFGAPASIWKGDRGAITLADAQRIAALVAASWEVFDGVFATTPARLRKGPRGGGRDRDAMAQHVLAAESAYARKLGIKQKEPAFDDEDAIAAMHDAICDVLSQRSDGKPPIPNGWPPRYAARWIAWHALDHAWEMEDRATGG